MSPELASKIEIWRAKALNNTLTKDEMREAIIALRADRVGASVASDKSRTSKRKADAPNAIDLLGEMMGD